MSKMKVIRKSCAIDQKRSYKIYLDNYYIGKIRDNEVLEFDMLAGKHIIYFKMDCFSSRKINFTVEKENRCFEVEGGNNQFENIFKMLFAHADYINLYQKAVM